MNTNQNNTKQSSHMDDVHLISESGELYEFAKNALGDYINTICEHLSISNKFDRNRLVDSVFPKLKYKNTIGELEELVIGCATELTVYHHEYSRIAMWLTMNKLHSVTSDDYGIVVEKMITNVNRHGKLAPMVTVEFRNYVKAHLDKINAALDYDRDFNLTIFGYNTLEKAYLKKDVSGRIIERPQHMYMRVALSVHYRTGSFEKVIETYNLLSQNYFTHATPTLFNAGTTREQLSSCFLIGVEDDMGEIGECWKDCSVISKYAGGIGINVSNVRVDGAYIHSTQGKASGLRLLTVFNQIARYANQGGKRAGSIAIYIEPWHGDIMFFLDLKKNTGAETERARDLFLGLMINDIFMERVERDEIWSLMCPSECPNLLNKYGKEFNEAYLKYEADGIYVKQMPARDLWFKIVETQIETGVPYMLSKDAANYKTNQQNIGVINGSNLCVSGDTMILTSDGYINIRDNVNKAVNVWNGFEFSKVTLRKTGSNKELLTIHFSNGTVLKCTPEHKFYVDDGYERAASKLVVGDQLISHEYPVICDGPGDISSKRKYYEAGISAYSASENLFLEKKMFVPINYNLVTKVSWLSGFLLHAMSYNYDHALISVRHESKKILDDVRYLMNTIGCAPPIITVGPSVYELLISQCDLNKLHNLGVETTHILLPNENTKCQVTVTRIENTRIEEDTFCFTELKRHTGIFNGVITGQCTEILEVSTSKEYAVCNLASICLPKFVERIEGKPTFNHRLLYDTTRVITRNLDNIIDINFYPVDKAKVSNLKHRPIGMGVQGLADVFAIYKTPFDSEIARTLNRDIFETIYYGFLVESHQLALERGKYSSFEGSPISRGLLQFDMWGPDKYSLSGRWDFDDIRKKIMKDGMRNSLGTTVMPTASTSQINGNTECIEPYTANIYTRSTLAGNFYIVNTHMMRDLMEINMWNDDIIDFIKYYEGSIQNIPNIPDDIKLRYRTVWEMPIKSLIDMAADRAPFIDQTQSFNVFIAEPNFVKLTTCLFYGWRKGLKTLMYYLRSKPASEANKFGIDIEKIKEIESRAKNTTQENTDTDFFSFKNEFKFTVSTGPACPPGCLECSS